MSIIDIPAQKKRLAWAVAPKWSEPELNFTLARRATTASEAGLPGRVAAHLQVGTRSK